MNPMHEKLEGDLLDLLEGKLPAAEAARVKALLAADPHLADQIAGMVLDRAVLRSMPKTTAPPGLAESVLAQLERGSLLGGLERDVAATRRWGRSRLAIAALVAVLIGGLGYVVIQGVHTNKGQWDDWAHHQVAANTDNKRMPAAPEPAAPAAPPEIAKALATPAAPSAPAAAVPAPVVSERETFKSKAGDGLAVASKAATDAKLADAEGSLLAQAGTANDKQATPMRAGETLNVSMGQDGMNHAYKDAANATVALKSLTAGQAQSKGDDTPVVLTLVAGNTADVEQVQRLLATYTGNQNDFYRNSAAATVANNGPTSFGLAAGTNVAPPSPAANTTQQMGKAGGGNLVLNSANTYTGATVISGGTLQLNNSGGGGAGSPAAAPSLVTAQPTGTVQAPVPTTPLATPAPLQRTPELQGATRQYAAAGNLRNQMPIDTTLRLEQRKEESGRVLGNRNGLTFNNATDGRRTLSYRVRLSPQQLETLAATCNGQTLSRNDSGYALHYADQPQSNAGLDASRRDRDRAAKPAAAATVIAPGTVPPAQPAEATRQVTLGTAAETPVAPARQRQVAIDNPTDQRDITANQVETNGRPPLIDCIVTVIVPDDSPRAASPAQSPAK